MKSAYLLAKITPHAGTYQIQGIKKGYGKKGEMGKTSTRTGRSEGFIHSVEAAGFATATLPPGLSDLIFCKYAHNTEADENRLVNLVNIIVLHKAAKENWDISRIKQDTLGNVVKIAVREALSSGTCLECRGVKSVLKDMVHMDCEACDSTGYARISMRARAYMIGIHHETFRRSWKRRYNDILSMLTDWENEALWTIASRISD